MFPMMKRCLALLILLAVTVFAMGCSEEPVFDVDKFNYINEYVNEIVPAIEETRFDFDIWSTDMSNPEKREWLEMDTDKLRFIHQQYLTDDFPPFEEIMLWVVPVSDGDKKWTIQGDELVPALEQMERSSNELLSIMNEIVQSDDELFVSGKRDEMEAALIKVEDAAEKLSLIFYNK